MSEPGPEHVTGCECCGADIGTDPTGRTVCDPCYYDHGYSPAPSCPQRANDKPHP